MHGKINLHFNMKDKQIGLNQVVSSFCLLPKISHISDKFCQCFLMLSRYFFVTVLATLGIFVNNAVAAGVASGTVISNSATINYSVGAVIQPAITSDADSNIAGVQSTDFVVDNKINLTVIEADANFTSVVAGQLAAVTTFTVTNNGNTVQDYSLNGVSGVAGTVFGVANSFTATACITRVETDNIAGYSVADTTTFIDELAPDASRTVYVVCNIPTGIANNDQSVTQLTATTLSGGAVGLGAAVSEVNPNTQSGVEAVFADPATVASPDGTIPLQLARDATAFARDAFRVAGASVSVVKTATCSPAPADCSQAAPETIITYQLLVNVLGAGVASNLVITDSLAANLNFVTYQAGSITVNGVTKTDASDADEANYAGTTADTVTVNLGNPTAPATFNIQFKAKIK